MSTLLDVSNALAQTVDTVGGSVVRVEARRRMPATGVVWSADGLIASANHVVTRDDKIKIGLADGQTVAAKVVGRDMTTDLVLLKAEANGLTVPTWAGSNADTLKVGHLALALGRPGQTVQATLGVISAVGGAWSTHAGGKIDHYLQTDVVMYPGFSGGPLVDANGHVLGLNSSALMRGVSLAVPVATLNRLIESLAAHGRIRRGYLGVSTQAVRLPANLSESLGQEMGLLVAAVEPGSPADQGGLLLGDTIVALAGQAVQQYDDLLALLTPDRVDQATPVKVVRGGEVQSLSVTIAEKA